MDQEAHPSAQNETARRVAFFGGSFDPPHLGHLAIARAAQAALALDTVLFAPVGAQPLKSRGSTAAFAYRVAMTRLAIANEPGFALSLADAPTGAPNYTLETLLYLRAELPPGSELFCLMGADSFATLRRWHRAPEIPFAAALIVASRPGESLEDLEAALPAGLTMDSNSGWGTNVLKGHGFSPAVEIPTRVVALTLEGSSSDHFPALPIPIKENIELRRYTLRNPAGDLAAFYLLPNLEIEISATEIRRRLYSSTQSPLLPAPVLEYIRAHGLYRDLPHPD
jgi:nicotinate-nucleotide adenylyltransferase